MVCVCGHPIEEHRLETHECEIEDCPCAMYEPEEED